MKHKYILLILMTLLVGSSKLYAPVLLGEIDERENSALKHCRNIPGKFHVVESYMEEIIKEYKECAEAWEELRSRAHSPEERDQIEKQIEHFWAMKNQFRSEQIRSNMPSILNFLRGS
ncbi:hypothetical protein Bealeia1_00387 [Candidatus Bealeia paramacronuclearis]|uniref:Uncharacterized protein n=3 Tax=Candidatus Bealeia paramacronuclearis TaxID=1921001 RepID=A0ABZ2C2B1_9PROT|nr:hypothetical protein [Candidatus Bealeia paramacronuclearis]